MYNYRIYLIGDESVPIHKSQILHLHQKISIGETLIYEGKVYKVDDVRHFITERPGAEASDTFIGILEVTDIFVITK
jgi:hypothetical protein